ncbi:MAG: phosphate ABC transporter permease subunit PstC [Chloroflexota bacterium]
MTDSQRPSSPSPALLPPSRHDVARREALINRLIAVSGYSAIVFVVLVFVFLLRESLPAIDPDILPKAFQLRWYPIEDYFGLLPLLAGTLVVTFGAALFAVPLGIGTAIFIAEIAPRWAREILKPLVEALAGIPSVVLGFLGMLLLSPILRETFNLPTGLTALTGAILLGLISLPTIVSVAEDALDAVPRSYRDASLAIGATELQTIFLVTLPAARSGVITAILLGLGRSIGETMTVMMVTGNAPVLRMSLLTPVRTMTATIAAEMGEVAKGSDHYHMLFLIGLLLFLISLVINLTAVSVIFRQKKRAERILS